MAMNSKERLMRALNREKPDRLPVSVHEWQQVHLNEYLGGIDPLAAFQRLGLDADVPHYGLMGQYRPEEESAQWHDRSEVIKDDPDERIVHHTIETPRGVLTYKTGGNKYTTWITEHLIKRHEDVELIEQYLPVPKLDQAAAAREYDRVGDAGILRGYVWGDQPGCWQHACCLMDSQQLILEAMDNPDWVHRLLQSLLRKKLRFVAESLRGARYDLIETGGGAASDTVISPALHQKFCLPYDRALHRALHEAGHRITYHTCGGMMHILDLIIQNETDASETLAPPGAGGNIREPEKVRRVLAGKVAMIGGMDQVNILTAANPEDIRREVGRLFEGFGKEGGYILASSDHFFDVPVENLRTFAEAARDCVY